MVRYRAGTGKAPSAFGVELKRFRGLLNRWLSYQLDQVFDLSAGRSETGSLRTYGFLLLVAVAVLFVHVMVIAGSLLASRSPVQLGEIGTTALIALARTILVLGFCTALAMQLAGNFLADIFEIKDARIAWTFIGRLAFGRGEEVLRVRDGKVAEADRDSPILLIGGPGRVLAEYDTAALFEKPDGAPHVVGPVRGGRGAEDEADNPASASLLDGFERLREPIINLRDQYIGSLAGEPLTVTGRSLDGMPVSAVDVRGLYSIRRKSTGSSPTARLQQPYPFDAVDIENLIYRQSVPVLTEGPYASGEPDAWTNEMEGMIRGSLAEFMSQNRLSEYVAGVGEKESELAEFREDTILSLTLQLSTDAKEAGATNEASRPSFHPRTELSGKFGKYSAEFSNRARQRGLELHWIGVGTWKMPDENSNEAVQEKHLEAWRIARENARRAEPKALHAIADGALLDEKLRLIQAVPIASHEKNQSKYSDKEVLVESLLRDFWGQLGDALDIYYDGGTRSTELDTLEQATLKVEELLKVRQIGHLIGGGSMSRLRLRPPAAEDESAPPAPASRAEAEKYRALLSKLEGDYKVAEGMIANEGRRHPGVEREGLIERIVQRFERYGH